MSVWVVGDTQFAIPTLSGQPSLGHVICDNEWPIICRPAHPSGRVRARDSANEGSAVALSRGVCDACHKTGKSPYIIERLL
jgi:hypothetical protein